MSAVKKFSRTEYGFPVRGSLWPSVEIFWPTTGKTQIVKDLKPDRFYTIREDRPAAVESKAMRFTLAVPTDASHEPAPAALKATE